MKKTVVDFQWYEFESFLYDSKNIIYFFVCAETSHINKKKFFKFAKREMTRQEAQQFRWISETILTFFCSYMTKSGIFHLIWKNYVKLEWGIFKNICNLHSDVDLERLFLSILSILNILTCFLEIVHCPIELEIKF